MAGSGPIVSAAPPAYLPVAREIEAHRGSRTRCAVEVDGLVGLPDEAVNP
jgi:hypothetical protein